jgi:hypothetical protein
MINSSKKSSNVSFVKFGGILLIVAVGIILWKIILVVQQPQPQSVQVMAEAQPIITTTPSIVITQVIPSITPQERQEVPEISRGDVDRISKKISVMNSRLGGKLKHKGALFESLGTKYNFNSLLAAAISIHETGNGTSPACVNLRNPGGLMSNGKYLKSFKSIDDGIEAMLSNLKNLYIDQGLRDIESIGAKYCPVGAANDPTNLNRYWIPNVTKYYLEMEKEVNE